MIPRILFLILLSSVLTSAQVIKLPCEKLSKSNGLSQQTVNSVVQDNNGYLWFATQDGLNKYDGYEINIYNHNPNEKNSISSNLVENLCISKTEDRNIIWVGTGNGLNKFNIDEGTSERFYNEVNNPKSICSNTITSLYIDSRNNLWVGTVDGLSKFDMIRQTSVNYKCVLADKATISSNRINSIVEAPENSGIIWFATEKGLTKYDMNKNVFSRYFRIPGNSNSLLDNYANKLEYCKNGLLLIGTGKGISVFDIKKNSFENYSRISKTNLPIVDVRAIVQSAFYPGKVWLGTYDNLFIFDLITRTFSKVLINDNFSNSPNNILTICEDKFGLLWLGTYSQGLYKIVPKFLDFNHYMKNLDPSSFANNIPIWSIYKSKNNILWIGSDDGLYKINMNTGQNKIYGFGPSNATNTRKFRVRTINEEKDSKENILWLGVPDKGIIKFDILKETSQVFSLCINKINSFHQNNLYTIIDDNNGKLWIGRNGSGLCEFDKRTGEINCYNYISGKNTLDQWITTIIKSKSGSFWIGTYADGLFLFDPREKIFSSSFKTSNSKIVGNSILSLYEDSHNNLWIGTNGFGLNKYDVKQGKFQSYTTSNGLSNNVIYSILEDNSGSIWMSTNNGLSKFNPQTGIFTNYNSFDGLQGNEFNLGACYKSNDSELFFGGTNGLNSFHPEALTNSIPPVTLINSLKINGLRWATNFPIEQIHKLDLEYYQSSLSFSLIALHFQEPQKNGYRYMLVGYDQDWNYVNKPYEANYSNLSAGVYIFKAQSANYSGLWDNTGKSIELFIPKPFWKTIWFYISVSALLILLIYYFVKARIMSKVRIQQEREELRAKLAADFHDELGYTTTQISLLTSILKKEYRTNSDLVENYLDKISDNSNVLFDKMKEFNWELDPNKDTLYHLAVYLKNHSDRMFDSTNIAFELNGNLSEFENVKLPLLYRQHLQRIFKEGMHNILKHATDCTKVNLDIVISHGNILFMLTNDGKEFEVEKKSPGSGLTNMKKRADKLGAVLKIESGKNIGTKISLKVKLP